MYGANQFGYGGTSIQASRAFRQARGKPGDLGMLTVYQYGFEEPRPAPPPATPWGTYALVALAGWWLWKKWGKPAPARAQNPRRRRRNTRLGGRGRQSSIAQGYVVYPSSTGKRSLAAANALARREAAKYGFARVESVTTGETVSRFRVAGLDRSVK